MQEALRRWGPRVTLGEDLLRKREAYLATRFDKQRRLVRSKALRRAGFCPRRSGKTGATEALLVDGALDGPDHLVIIVAKTRQRAHDLTWRPVARACKAFGIPTAPEPANSETLKSVYVRTFPNGSAIRWTGADNLAELDKKRGEKLRRVVIEEAQDIDPSILHALVFDVFGPSLEDLGGDLILMGTPDEICAGMWFGITATDDELGEDAAARVPGYEVHRWTPFDNPHIPRIHARLKNGEIAKECGGPDSPTYLREWRGKWVRDTGGLFYKFDPARNVYKRGAVVPYGEGWLHVLGWDLGSNDDMAIVVWGWHPKHGKTLYEAFSWKKPGALVDECAAVIKACRNRFTVVAMVADTGGGGKMFVEELSARHKLSFEPAKKTEKHAHVKLFNADLVAGRLQLELGSEYAKEIARLPKVKDWDEAKTGEPAPEDPRFPNHCCDGGLYSWRRAYAFLHEAEARRPEPDSPEGKALEAAEAKQRRAERLQQRQERAWWEQ
jgi:hypothetical protein